MYQLHQHQRVDIDADVYIARARRGYPELLLNLGYDECGVLDLVGGAELRRIAYPEPDFGIYAWLVSPDGASAHAFSGDELDYAFAMDLEAGEAVRVRVPDSSITPTDLGWFEPTFSVLDYERRLWRQAGDRFELATREQTAERLGPDLRAFLDHYVVKKLGAIEDEVYVRGRDSVRNPVGVYRWSTGQAQLVDTDGSMVDWCTAGGSLFLVYEKQVVQVFGGRSTVMMKAEEDELFVQINAFEHEGQVYLGLVGSAEDHDAPPKAYVTTYRATR